jgi:hypothetical protein
VVSLVAGSSASNNALGWVDFCLIKETTQHESPCASRTTTLKANVDGFVCMRKVASDLKCRHCRIVGAGNNWQVMWRMAQLRSSSTVG